MVVRYEPVIAPLTGADGVGLADEEEPPRANSNEMASAMAATVTIVTQTSQCLGTRDRREGTGSCSSFPGATTGTAVG